MDFPIADLMDERACYDYLVGVLHPEGLRCPRCQRRDLLGVHRRHREPVLDFQCGHCGCVFNAWAGTALAGTHHRPSALVLILRGFLQGTPTARLARELGIDRKHLLGLRHRLGGIVQAHQRDDPPLGDGTSEADEMYQNAGEKGIPHDDPEDPPRRRANKRRGHGTFSNDRPPVAGAFGRQSGQARLEVIANADGATLSGFVRRTTPQGGIVNTDEWVGYGGLGGTGRAHRRVNHSATPREWARDDDGDGVREVHVNTAEGVWTGLRNFLRVFRGVSKHYLGQYAAVFQLGHNFKKASATVLRILLGVLTPSTDLAS